MKNCKETTLISASHRAINLGEWLNSSNSLLTTLMGCRISNQSLVGIIAFTLFAFAAILLASDAISEYGWAAFCALAAVNGVLPLLNEFKKGGNSHD